MLQYRYKKYKAESIMKEETNTLLEKIKDADYVLIGIGEEFNEDFSNIDKYPEIMKTLDEVSEDDSKKWMIPFLEKEYLDAQTNSRTIEALHKLYEAVKDKNYFLVTTCIDGNVGKAGFDKEKYVEPCGGYHHLQCEEKCTTDLYDLEEFKEKIRLRERPVCPKCGKPLVLNNIICNNYTEEGYLPQWEIYTGWLQKTLNRKLVVIELGVGLNLPTVIRSPFERVAFFNQKASFYRVNEGLYEINDDLKDKGVSIKCNAVDYLLNEF